MGDEVRKTIRQPVKESRGRLNAPEIRGPEQTGRREDEPSCVWRPTDAGEPFWRLTRGGSAVSKLVRRAMLTGVDGMLAVPDLSQTNVSHEEYSPHHIDSPCGRPQAEVAMASGEPCCGQTGSLDLGEGRRHRTTLVPSPSWHGLTHISVVHACSSAFAPLSSLFPVCAADVPPTRPHIARLTRADQETGCMAAWAFGE
jgi:hypothetical protein